MADIFTAAQRSAHMSRILGKNTKPEMAIRQGLHGRGFRYSLHRRDLPGTPDIVLRKYNAVIFVNGCFWHGHMCPLGKLPATRVEWWREKIEGNRARDARTHAALREKGWRRATVWECALKGRGKKKSDAVLTEIGEWLRSSHAELNIEGNRPRQD